MDDLISEIIDFSEGKKASEGVISTPYPGLSLLCDAEPSRIEAMVYDPVVCLVLQGSKETYIGDRCIRFGAGESLIVSHTTPVNAAVVEASREKPYVAMILTIDLDITRSLYDEVEFTAQPEDTVYGLEAAKSDPKLCDVMGRLFRASLVPSEAKALGPLYERELHYRLLQADHGGMLRQMLWRDSAASRIGRAIAHIRAEYANPLPVSDLAALANMSVSAFHEHFKSMTSKSPLQFQKELRLTEARRLLRIEGQNVSAAAFAVGYESPTQFSREYSRKFGVPPREDMLRRSAA